MKVMTFATRFPVKHTRAGQSTHFVEKICKGLLEQGHKLPEGIEGFTIPDVKPKWTTIRGGYRWRVGEQFSPRIWSGTPRRSKQIEFAEPITIVKIWKFIMYDSDCFINGKALSIDQETGVALNDGLERTDFLEWFRLHPKRIYVEPSIFEGQIICWNKEIEYL